MKIKIKKTKVLDEMNSMSSGAVQGFAGGFGDQKTVDAFNKEEERDQRLKGSKLTEMYSTRGLSGRNMQQVVSGEEEHDGHVERSQHQGLKNVMENDETLSLPPRDPAAEMTTEQDPVAQVRKKHGNEVANLIEKKGLKVLAELGEGMFGTVLKVDDFDEEKALKIVADGPKWNGVDWKEREIRNYRVIGDARGSNPLIAKHFPAVYEIWRAGSYGLILMELLEPIASVEDVFVPDKVHSVSKKFKKEIAPAGHIEGYSDQSKKAATYFRSVFPEWLKGRGEKLANFINKNYSPTSGVVEPHHDLQIEISPTNILALETLFNINREAFDQKIAEHYDYIVGLAEHFPKTARSLRIVMGETQEAPYLALAMAIIARVMIEMAYRNDQNTEPMFLDEDVRSALVVISQGYRQFSAFRTGYDEKEVGKDSNPLSGEWNETFKALFDATNLIPKDMHFKNVMQRPSGDLVIVDLGLFREPDEKGFKRGVLESKKYRVKITQNPRKNGIIK